MDSHASKVSSNDGVDSAVDVINRQTVTGVNDFIHEQYSEEPLSSYLPSVLEKLAETVTYWCCNVHDREEIRNVFLH